MPRESFAATVGSWKLLIDSVGANSGDFQQFEQKREQLEALFARARQLLAERDAHDAAKQLATRELQGVLEEGRMLATFLRQTAKQRYGNRSEKLVEFGVQPRRRRPRRRASASDSQD